MTKNFIFNDGGRSAAGFKGSARDCAARSVAIAFAMSYKAAYEIIALANQSHGGAKSARDGIYNDHFDQVLLVLGWRWHSAPVFPGRKARCADMPGGVVIARQAGHFVAVIDGVPHDTFDCSNRMVYGFWGP